MELKNYIASIQDFPKEGILFRDMTPLLADGEAFNYTIDKLAEFAASCGATVIAGPEARGFIFGTPVSYKLNLGFVPVRKPGKLPRKVVEYNYSLEYGTNTLCMHEDAIKKGDKVVLIDDLLATGGSIEACIKLVEQLGGEVVKTVFLMELEGLEGRKKIAGYDVETVIAYPGK